jgi:hypothetical protein
MTKRVLLSLFAAATLAFATTPASVSGLDVATHAAGDIVHIGTANFKATLNPISQATIGKAQLNTSNAPTDNLQATAQLDTSNAPIDNLQATAQLDTSNAPIDNLQATAQLDTSNVPIDNLQATAQLDTSNAQIGNLQATAQLNTTIAQVNGNLTL